MDRQRALQIGGYAAFTFLAFGLSLYLTLPADAVAQRLGREVQRQSHGTWSMAYAEASPYRLSGLQLERVTLKRTLAGAEPLSVTLDLVQARLRLLPLLLLRLSVDARLQLGDGTLSARISPHGNAVDATVVAEALNLASPPLLARLTGLPIGGEVSGNVETTFDKDLTKSAGDADLQIAGANVGPGTVAGFSLPAIALGNLALAAEVKEGKLKIKSFAQKGGNIALQLKGSAQLREPLSASLIDVCAQLRADPTFLNTNPKIRTVLQLAEVQLKKDAEGYMHVPVAGPVLAPHLTGGLCR